MPCVLFAHTQLRDLYFDFVLLRDNYVFCIVQHAYLYFILVRDNYVFSIVVLSLRATQIPVYILYCLTQVRNTSVSYTHLTLPTKRIV